MIRLSVFILLLLALQKFPVVAAQSANTDSEEMMPKIISIDNLQKIREGYTYYLTFSVTFTGAESITVSLEQEYSPLVRTYTFNGVNGTANVTTKKQTLAEYTWVTISVTNNYGTASETLEFEPELTDDSVSEIIHAEADAAPMFDLRGRRISTPRPGRIYIQSGRKHLAH